MAVKTGYGVVIKLLSCGSCTCSSGALTIANNACTALPYMDTYTYDESIEAIDVTAFGDYLRQEVDGFPAFTVSMSGGLDLSNAVQLGLANNATCHTNRKPRLFTIYDGGKTLQVRGRITSNSQGSSVGAKSTFSLDLSLTHLPKWS